MKKRISIVGICLTLLLASTLTITLYVQPVKAESGTIVVPDDYPTIQEAIDNANDEDTIMIRAGTYYENIVVDKPLTLIGENKETTVIDGNRTSHVVRVTAQATIIGFTVQNSSPHVYGHHFEKSHAGFYVESPGNNISNNIIIKNEVGIVLRSSNNHIEGCNISFNSQYGIYLYYSNHNNITGNTITFNNAAKWNRGIFLDSHSDENNVLNNIIKGQEDGIYISGYSFSDEGNYLAFNTITSCSYYGIKSWMRYVEIIGNNVSSNRRGITLESLNYRGGYSTVSSNWITQNEVYAIEVWSDYNLIYNNYFDPSSKYIQSDEYHNSWNIAKTPGENIIGGPYLGGNYWSDYRGVDEDGDGLGDTPYAKVGWGQDNLPLVPITGSPMPVLVSVNYQDSIMHGDWSTITITAKNDAPATAKWQTVHCGFPDNPPEENIQIVSHDMNGGAEIYLQGSSLPANYGECNITSTYVMVEGVHGPWENGETHTMTVRVKPENTGTFTFYVKTVNRAFSVTYYDPTDTKDQQDEYVYVYEITVTSRPPEAAKTALTLETPPPRVLAYQTVIFTGQLIREDDGSGISDALVKIYEKDPLSEEFLAEGRTDQQGRFEISWFATPTDFNPIIPIYIDKMIEVQAKFEGSSKFSPSTGDVHEITVEPIDVYTDRGGQGLDSVAGSYTRSDVVKSSVARFDFDFTYPSFLRLYFITVFDPSGKQVFSKNLDSDDELAEGGGLIVSIKVDFPLSSDMPLGTYRVEAEYAIAEADIPLVPIHQIGKDVTYFTVMERYEVDINGATFAVDLITNSDIVSVQPLVDSTRTVLELSGDDGTTGWLNLTVSKSMVTSLGGNKDTIHVLIDGGPSNFTVSEIDEHYTITVNYSHSIRVIEIFYTTTSFFPTTIIVIALIAVLVTVPFTVYLRRRKRLRPKRAR